MQASALTATAFAPFGDVIEAAGRRPTSINAGTARRFADLAHLDLLEAGGRPILSIVQSSPRPLPLRLSVLERHPLSSQAFIPLDARPFLIVVAHDGAEELSTRIRAFIASGNQGVNYRRNTWHHPLIALEATCRFLAVERGGTGQNCDEAQIRNGLYVAAP
ncbi:MAG: ureidoglycolate lyase [Gammaproteobacteria bacterium]|nr:ureidoglycolate lyase [Gammaproteobacteria bacterium]